MELEEKYAHTKGLTLNDAVDGADRQQQLDQLRRGWSSTVGDQTRAAAMASAAGRMSNGMPK